MTAAARSNDGGLVFGGAAFGLAAGFALTAPTTPPVERLFVSLAFAAVGGFGGMLLQEAA